MPNGAEWDLLLLLPNLAVPDQTPFDGAVIQICSSTAPPVRALKETPANATNLRLLRRFRTSRGQAYEPACLVIRADAMTPDADAIRDFRNACAICAVSSGRCSALLGHGQWVAYYSDFFTFSHHLADRSGSVGTLAGISRGADDEVESILGTSAAMIGRPDNFSVSVDKPLFGYLLRAWRRKHLSKTATRPIRQAFRALEIAIHASSFPSDGFTTMNDRGTRIGLWVSAFEVLFHPGTKVDKRVVQQRLAAAPWITRLMQTTRHEIVHRGQSYPATLPERIYDVMYQARNDFMHGNRIRQSSIFWRYGNRSASLEFVAAALFGAALRAALGGRPRKVEEQVDEHFFGMRRIEKALQLKDD
jgi:hypothetical protein